MHSQSIDPLVETSATVRPSPTAAYERSGRYALMGRLIDEASETCVVLVAGRASLEMRPHSWNGFVGIRAGQLELDIVIQVLEALVAAELGPLSTNQRAQQLAVFM